MEASKRPDSDYSAKQGDKGSRRRKSSMDMWPRQANTDKIAGLLRSFRTRGAIAQLGERIVRNDEVVGSSPTSSTKFWLNGFNGAALGLKPRKRDGSAHFAGYSSERRLKNPMARQPARKLVGPLAAG